MNKNTFAATMLGTAIGSLCGNWITRPWMLPGTTHTEGLIVGLISALVILKLAILMLGMVSFVRWLAGK